MNGFTKQIWLPIFLVVIIAASCVVWYVTGQNRRNLERFLQAVGMVEVGKTSIEEFQKVVAQPHIADLVFGCQREYCTFNLQTRNELLRHLRLAPLTVVQSSLTFKNGVASRIYIVFEIERGDGPQNWRNHVGLVVLQDGEKQSCNGQFNLTVKRNGGAWASVGMDRCVVPASRQEALAINGACLTRIGGCKRLEDLNPRLFK